MSSASQNQEGFHGIQLTSNEGDFVSCKQHKKVNPATDVTPPVVPGESSQQHDHTRVSQPQKMKSRSSSIGFNMLKYSKANDPFTISARRGTAGVSSNPVKVNHVDMPIQHIKQTGRGCREKTRDILNLIETDDDPRFCCEGCCSMVTLYNLLSALATLMGVLVEILKNTKYIDESGNRVWYSSPYPSPLTLHLMSIVLGAIFGVEVLIRFSVAESYIWDAHHTCSICDRSKGRYNTGTLHNSGTGYMSQTDPHASGEPPFFRNAFNWFDILSIPPFNTGFFRILRVFRLSSRWESSSIVSETIYKSGRPILVSMLYLLSMLTLVASVFFFFESCYYRTCEMPDLFSITYFLAITITTVGYGDKVPSTWYGKLIAIVVMLAGSFFLAMPLSIVGTEFERAFDENEKKRERQDKTGRLQLKRELRNLHVTIQQRQIRAMQLGYKVADMIEASKEQRLRLMQKFDVGTQLRFTPSKYTINADRELIKMAQQLIRDILIIFKVNPEEFRSLAEEVAQVKNSMGATLSSTETKVEWSEEVADLPHPTEGSSRHVDGEQSGKIDIANSFKKENHSESVKDEDRVEDPGEEVTLVSLVEDLNLSAEAESSKEDDVSFSTGHEFAKKDNEDSHSSDQHQHTGIILMNDMVVSSAASTNNELVVHPSPNVNDKKRHSQASHSKGKRTRRRSAEDIIGDILSTQHNRESLSAIPTSSSLSASFAQHLRPKSELEKRVLFRNPTLAKNMLKLEIEAAQADENYDSKKTNQPYVTSQSSNNIQHMNSRTSSINSIALADNLLTSIGHMSPMKRAIDFAEKSNDCRSRLWLLMEVPWHSRLSKLVRGGRLIFTLLSLILLYCETIPALNRYGPGTRMCKQIVNYHCGKVPNTPEGRIINPLCFPNSTANYSGCRDITPPSDFKDCGFPTSLKSAEDGLGIDFSCKFQNQSQGHDGPVIRYTDTAPWAFGVKRDVRICERMQCTENSSQDYSHVFAVSEVIVVVIFIIELALRIIASTRPIPFENTEDQTQRRKLHWTWSRLVSKICKTCCHCCYCCSCCDRCPCRDDDHESEYLNWFAQNMNDEYTGAGVRDFAGTAMSSIRDKHKSDSVVYGLKEWFAQANNQIDVLSTVCAVGEVIWVPLSFTYNNGFNYEVWGLSSSFDPAVFRVVRVLVSMRFISMERFFDDTVAIRHTVAHTAFKLIAPIFFLMVFVLIVAALFIWIEVDVSSDMYECDDWSKVLGVSLTSEQFHSRCKRCAPQDLDLSDPFMGNKKRYDGTCRRVINEGTDKPFMWQEPLVQTFDESIWFVFVTVTTTGYGRFVPMTMLGKVVMTMTSLAGVLYLAMPLTVVSAKFYEIYTKMKESNRYRMLYKAKKRARLEAKQREERMVQRTTQEASSLTFRMVVTLKMLARRVRTRSQIRAPLKMSQQRLVADYEEQIYEVSFLLCLLFCRTNICP